MYQDPKTTVGKVAPREGAWIEIARKNASPRYPQVAPREGAWIEIKAPEQKQEQDKGRSPRGSVD